MTSMNRATLIGHIGQEPSTKKAGNGQVTEFSLATTWSRKNPNTGEWDEHTDWHSVCAWNLSERLLPYIAKGAKVLVEGRIQTRSWEDGNGQKRYKTEIIANARDLMLVKPAKDAPANDGRSPSVAEQNAMRNYAGKPPVKPTSETIPTDDGSDIPF